MYFNLIPNIQYDTKPIGYPFTKSDFVTAKNFFRRYQINPDVFSYSVYYDKYAIREGETPSIVSNRFYDTPFYDWVVLITNNVINPLFDWPMSSSALQKYCENRYGDPYATIVHYETDAVITNQTLKGDATGRQVKITALEAGLKVDENFYNSSFRYWDGTNTITVPGSSVCHPVSAFDYEQSINESRREIYILKSIYLQQFVTEFKKDNNYRESSDFISKRLKKTGV